MDDLTDDDGSIVVIVTGELDILTSAALTRQFRRAFDRGPRRIVVDLTQVSFFDSTGLRTIEDARAEAVGDGCALVLVCTDPRVLRLFEITDVLELYPIYASVAEAIAG